MFRMWGKIFKDNRLMTDYVSEIDYDDTRTHKIINSLNDISNKLNLENPIWLDSNIDEFKKTNKTRFTSDSFIENIDFDYLEIQIIEE